MFQQIKNFLGFYPRPPATAPEWLKTHYSNWANFDRGQALDQIRFVVFDTETTGLDPKTDSIISIGAVCIEAGRIKINDSLEVFVKQSSAGNQESIPIHGLIGTDLTNGLTEREAIETFLNFSQQSILVAHNTFFDMAMLNSLTQSLYGTKVQNPAIDTFQLASRLEGTQQLKDHFKGSDYTLEALCKRYQIPQDNKHNAAGDAFATAILFCKLYQKALARGIDTIGDLLG